MSPQLVLAQERFVRSRCPGWSASYLISLLRPVPTLTWSLPSLAGVERRQGNINKQVSESPLFKACCKHLGVDQATGGCDNVQCLGQCPKQEGGTWQRTDPRRHWDDSPLARGCWEEPGALQGRRSQVSEWMAEENFREGVETRTRKKKVGLRPWVKWAGTGK